MLPFLTYELKVAVLLAVFFGLYTLLMRRDTLFRQRRMTLLSIVLLSAVLPLCQIEWHVREIITADTAGTTGSITQSIGAPPTFTDTFIRYATISGFVLLIAGMAVMTIRSVMEVIMLKRLISRQKVHKTADGSTIVVSNHATRPFSYLRYIVMSEKDFQENHQALIIHEQAHISHHHTLDLFLTNVILTLQWFNPLAWQLRKELNLVHEYEADEEVLNAGISSADYLRLLISKATGKGKYAFANTLSERRMLRQRIEMLAKDRSPKRARMKILFLLPVVAVSLGLSAHVVKDYVFEPAITDSTPREEKATDGHQAQKSQEKTVMAKESAGNKTESNNEEEDSVEYMVNGIHVDKPSIDNISPGQVKQVTIIKHQPDNQDSANDTPHKRTVYVDLNDTIIKKVDNDTYILFDSQEEYDRFKQESDDISRDMEQVRNEAEAAQTEAHREAETARNKMNEARAKRHREAERLRDDADKLREEALRKHDQAKQYADRAKAYKEEIKAKAEHERSAIRMKAIQERQEAEKARRKARAEAIMQQKKAVTERERIRRDNAIKRQNSTMRQNDEAESQLHVLNSLENDTTTLRLIVESDGTVSNIIAYQSDTTSNGDSLMLVCKKEGMDMVVLYKRI